MKNGGGHFAPKLGGQFELESGGHFKLELGGQYHWNLHKNKINYWIINKIENTRLGPFTKIEFEKELVLNKVNLKFE